MVALAFALVLAFALAFFMIAFLIAFALSRALRAGLDGLAFMSVVYPWPGRLGWLLGRDVKPPCLYQLLALLIGAVISPIAGLLVWHGGACDA